MLKIKIDKQTLWDEKNEVFIELREQELKLEHSLVSLSKWESKWNKPFISKAEKTLEEEIDYIKCMTLNSNDVDPIAYYFLSNENKKEIDKYINLPMTATTFYIDEDDKNKKNKNSEKVTSELIYYWMIAFNIPFECQKWHLNRLLTLITVCDIKNTPPKKRSKSDIMRRNAKLNAQRKKRLNSKG